MPARGEEGGGGGGPGSAPAPPPPPQPPAPPPQARPPAPRMARRPEVLCGAALLLGGALLLVLKAACSRAKDVTMPAKLPVKFFSLTSPVHDLFLGQLDRAEDIRQDSEVTLFFFYAPWCGQSVAVREELEKVAHSLADQVLFVAINCWWNQGKCRKQKHFFYFPVIYLYHRSFGPIEYKGPMNAVYMEKFVRRVMTPLLYISSRSKLRRFLSSYEPGVLGYFEFNASPQPPGYLTFFASALHSLDKDYLGSIHFGVVTDKLLAREVPLTHSGSVYLHRHVNSSLLYPHEALNYTAENVCRWALENRELFVRWLRPHGGKSLLLHSELKKGPALFVFLPFDPLAESQPRVEEISRLALEYRSCDGSWKDEAEGEALRGELLAAGARPPLAEPPRAPRCCHTIVLPPQWQALSRTHNVCELCVNQTAGARPSRLGGGLRCSFLEMEAALAALSLQERPFLRRLLPKTAFLCSNFLRFYSPFSYYTACCRTVNGGLLASIRAGKTAFLPFASHGRAWHDDDPPGSFPHIEDRRGLRGSSNVTGLSCRTNRTLNLYLLDSNLSWKYAERLGASRERPAKEFAAIVDLKEEAHYVLDQSQALVKSNLETFIQNYSVVYSPLRRHLVGGEGSSRHRRHAQRAVREAATATFREIVLRTEKDVLLLYYSPWCGFCMSLNHVFIQLARILPPECFIVARIDVSQNDLPWEFVADRLPTVLFFPRNRKEHSVKFPADLPLTLPNLLKFILRHSVPLPPPAGPDPCLGDGLQQGRLPHLERELQNLRAEVQALHRAQAQLQGRLSDARREEQRLQQEARALREQHQALQSQRQQLQALYDRKSRELEELAEKLQELAEASESLLAENALLKVLVASVERKRGATAELEIRLPQEEAAGLAVPAVDGFRETDAGDNPQVDTRLASEHSKENWTE